MKRQPRTKNERLSSEKERRKKYIIKNVVKRGRPVTLTSLARWASRVVKVAAFGAFVAGIYWCATTGYRKLFWENPDYALKETPLRTDGTLTEQQVLSAAGIVKGRNIFAYDLDSARAALKALPQVENAELRRYLPSRIEISITERKPVAWITAERPKSSANAQRTHLIDARGLVFKPRVNLPEFQPLPVIITSEDIVPGKAIRTAELVTAIELLRRTRESGEFQIQMVDTTKGYAVVVTDQRGAEITFNLDENDLDRQLGDLRRVRAQIAKTGQDAKSINVMPTKNIPVTFMPPSARDDELEALLDERKPRNAAPAETERSLRPGQPGRRGESTPAPGRSRQQRSREQNSVVRPFRTAA